MDNSGLNTGLLLIVVIALVGGAVWYFTTQSEKGSDASIEITVPNNDSE